MKILSIFIDESGDFGEYSVHSPYYILSMVFHDQSVDISEDIKKLQVEMNNIGHPDICFHVGPMIRGEFEYRNVSIEERKTELKRMMTFFRHLNVLQASILVKKKSREDEIELVSRLSKELSYFLRSHQGFFSLYDKIIIYYDNGQIEVNKILSAVFSIFIDNIEFRKVLPAQYRLLQIADLICTLKLIETKMENGGLSKSEKAFFGTERVFKKNYLKTYHAKELE